ncbi:hypothetical protein SHKM778_06890 [Streptomyces sp. KM77-8]|uniref:Uncharacterized protein n=1 Tax=Streptomyces haneummycinicus TaxID=3074435 RepID=A0AAT9HAB0_9ACTN
MRAALRTLGTATLTLVLSTVVLTQSAHAAKPVGSDKGATTEQRGGSDGNGIYAAARIQYSGSVAKRGGKGNVTSTDLNWTPPPCWYAPTSAPRTSRGRCPDSSGPPLPSPE